MTMLKRQREAKKAEKAAEKRAKRQGVRLAVPPEPKPTIDVGALTARRDGSEKLDP